MAAAGDKISRNRNTSITRIFVMRSEFTLQIMPDAIRRNNQRWCPSGPVSASRVSIGIPSFGSWYWLASAATKPWAD